MRQKKRPIMEFQAGNKHSRAARYKTLYIFYRMKKTNPVKNRQAEIQPDQPDQGPNERSAYLFTPLNKNPS